MADIKKCWQRVAHEPHGWSEGKLTGVDGRPTTRLISMVDASTVLKEPELLPGEIQQFHHCDGVEDLLPATKNMPVIRPGWRDYETLYRVDQREENSIFLPDLLMPSSRVTFRTERRVTIEAVYERMVIETEWVEVQRITCYCCSCDSESGHSNDPACRNHGFAAVRPCEVHGTPGSTWDAEGLNVDGSTPDWHDTMPESVQEARKGNNA